MLEIEVEPCLATRVLVNNMLDEAQSTTIFTIIPWWTPPMHFSGICVFEPKEDSKTPRVVECRLKNANFTFVLVIATSLQSSAHKTWIRVASCLCLFKINIKIPTVL